MSIISNGINKFLRAKYYAPDLDRKAGTLGVAMPETEDYEHYVKFADNIASRALGADSALLKQYELNRKLSEEKDAQAKEIARLTSELEYVRKHAVRMEHESVKQADKRNAVEKELARTQAALTVSDAIIRGNLESAERHFTEYVGGRRGVRVELHQQAQVKLTLILSDWLDYTKAVNFVTWEAVRPDGETLRVTLKRSTGSDPEKLAEAATKELAETVRQLHKLRESETAALSALATIEQLARDAAQSSGIWLTPDQLKSAEGVSAVDIVGWVLRVMADNVAINRTRIEMQAGEISRVHARAEHEREARARYEIAAEEKEAALTELRSDLANKEVSILELRSQLADWADLAPLFRAYDPERFDGIAGSEAAKVAAVGVFLRDAWRNSLDAWRDERAQNERLEKELAAVRLLTSTPADGAPAMAFALRMFAHGLGDAVPARFMPKDWRGFNADQPAEVLSVAMRVFVRMVEAERKAADRLKIARGKNRDLSASEQTAAAELANIRKYLGTMFPATWSDELNTYGNVREVVTTLDRRIGPAMV